MAELIAPVDAERVRANLARVREEIVLAAREVGRDPSEVQVLAATKYVALEDLPALAEAGVWVVGENRAQDLQRKVGACGERFAWHFIGQLQSRRVGLVVPHARMIHSLASESALRALEHHREQARPGMEVLVQVNVARAPGKAGVAPEELPRYLERSPFRVAGLMTMPPPAGDPDDSRRWFAALRELAREHGLAELSMGTSQDYTAAVEEGATIVRLGSVLLR
ncbi:MAG TPA: YggS family pyridoxal phosphate-dependent enzyme [Solirubrobacteraceae bacterium]|nr:YggS family pyridoxal phosphate-dependent enzyme [Solirubrobacteraceae bacterium]